MSTQPAIANSRTRQEWAAIINADWRKSIESIIQTGRDLLSAKGELSHGEFTKMVDEDLSFSYGVAKSLMNVAKHPEIANSRDRDLLPQSWTVLNQLARLSPEDFLDARERGLISPDTGQWKATAIAVAYSKKTPPDAVVGEGRKAGTLPTPTEARSIARETGRLVAASDGNTYSGATAEEGAEYASRRTTAFRVLEAINLLAESNVTAFEWLERAEPHWLHGFRPGAIDDAVEWLTTLKEAMGVVDA